MARFPKGTVTFLCATIDTSHGGAAPLRTAASSHGGVVFLDSGTSFQAAFSSALPALRAALQAQRHILAGEAAGAQAAVPALALHTGRAQERNGHYAGPTINRARSILAAAHPGQVLISSGVYDALQDSLPDGVQLQPLGEHRLKDLLRTTQLYQAVAPGIPGEFPPLLTLDAHRHNLPIQDSPLIGREQEVAITCTLLRDPANRLLTLLGSSGMGKTRLALQAAVEAIDDFPDGVYFVALAPVSDPTLLISEIAHVLGVKEQAGQPLLETLGAFLQSRSMLLVLDNFEQLLAAGPTLTELLAATAALTVLVTSQVALEIDHEQVFVVPPLAMPDPARPIMVDELAQIPAVALFVERARDVQPTFTLTELMAPAVIELCTRLEGLPLAIELVAAQSRRYFPSDMLVMLQNRLSVARATRRGNTREDTLRPVLDWICAGLGPAASGLLARLGVFSGGCTSESASEICNPANDLGLDVEEALALLLANHLLLREELREGHARYTMLDAIQDYAHGRLVHRREVDRLQSAHAAYYARLAETAEPLLVGPEQKLWLARLDDEHHNLRAALRWSLEHQAEQALHISGILASRFWYVHGHYTEGRQWLEAAMAQAAEAAPPIRAKALHGLGVLAFAQSDFAVAIQSYEAAVAMRRELGDTIGVAMGLHNLGVIAMHQGDNGHARSMFAQGLPAWRELGHSQGVFSCLNNMAILLFNDMQFDEAAPYLNECVALQEASGDTRGLALTLGNLGRLFWDLEDYDQASQVLDRAMALAQATGDQSIQSSTLENQARVSLARGDLATTWRLLTECIRIRQRLNEKLKLVRALEALADLLLAEGQPATAVQLLGAAEALRQALGTPPSLVDQRHIDALTARALSHVSQPTFDEAYQAGAAMALDDLLDRVLATSPQDHA